MPAGLQSHHHISPPQSSPAASPSRQMVTARLRSPPRNPFCSRSPPRGSGGGVAAAGTGLGRAGQAAWEEQRLRESQALHRAPRGHPDTSMDPLLWQNLFGKGERSAATGSHRVTTVNHCHQVLSQSQPPSHPHTNYPSSVVCAKPVFVLNLMSVKYFGFKLFCRLTQFSSASPSRQNNLVVSETDSP